MGWNDIPPQQHTQTSIGWDALPPSAHSAAMPSEPSALESFGRGAVNQFGVAPAVVGAASSLPEVLKLLSGNGSLDEINQAYSKARDESQRNFETADQAHPGWSLAGNITGAVLPALLTGGTSAGAELAEQGVAGAAKAGVAYGGASALGTSLSKGEGIDDTIKHGIEGMGTGGLTGGALGLAGKGLKAFAGSKTGETLASAFGMGQEGDNLLNPAVRKAIGQEDFGLAQKIRDQIGQREGGLRSLKGKAIKSIVSGAEDKPLEANGLVDKIQGLISGLDEDNPLERADKSYLTKMLEGYTTTTDPDVVNMTAGGVQKMKGAFQSASPFAADSLKTGYGGAISKLAAQASGQEAEALIPGLEKANNEFSSVDKANKLMGMNPLSSKADEDALSKLADRIYRYQNVTKTGDKSRRFIDAGLGHLADVDPNMASDIKNQILNTSRRVETARAATNESVHVGGGLPGMVMGASTQIANVAGQGAAGVSKAISGTSKVLTSMVPQQLSDLAKKLSGSPAGQKLGNILTEAASRDEVGRNALIYTIMQQPSYRELLSNFLPGT